MLKKALLGLAALVAVFAVVVATQPGEFHIERSAVINTTPDVVFPEVVELKRFANWSPWDKLDPNMKKSYEGTDGTVGASQAWEGNDDVGQGKMTITEVVPNQKIVHKLEFLAPMEATNTVTFTLAAEGTGTKVTWAMDGHNGFVSKAFCLFMDMDAMVGGDFEKGLTSLKQISEENAAKLAAAAAEAQKKAEAEAQAAAAPAAPEPKKTK